MHLKLWQQSISASLHFKFYIVYGHYFDIQSFEINMFGSSWPWSYDSFYNYLCLSPLVLWVRILIRARSTTLCDKFCPWLATGPWFSLSTLVSSTNKTDRHDMTEILLKVTLRHHQTNKQHEINIVIVSSKQQPYIYIYDYNIVVCLTHFLIRWRRQRLCA